MIILNNNGKNDDYIILSNDIMVIMRYKLMKIAIW